jgi:hypothetical protein
MSVPRVVKNTRHGADLDDDGHEFLENSVTVETDTTLVPHPDGTGGVEWGAGGSGGGMVPYYIASGDTFTVPLYSQALYAMEIDNAGTLDVVGHLIEVD